MEPKRITSRDNEQVKQAVRLAGSGALRREERLFFAETPKLCLDLAAAGAQVKTLFYTAEALERHPAVQSLAGEHFLVTHPVADKLSSQQQPAGVFALFQLPQENECPLEKGGHYLALEGLQDPANVGAALRSAAAFGWQGAFLLNCADPYSPKALRAAMGATVKLPLWQLESADDLQNRLQPAGIPLAAAVLEDAVSLTAFSGENGVCVAIGSEGQGLSPQLIALADQRLYIPMAPGTESLNAAAAAAVFLWQLRKARGDSL